MLKQAGDLGGEFLPSQRRKRAATGIGLVLGSFAQSISFQGFPLKKKLFIYLLETGLWGREERKEGREREIEGEKGGERESAREVEKKGGLSRVGIL